MKLRAPPGVPLPERFRLGARGAQGEGALFDRFLAWTAGLACLRRLVYCRIFESISAAGLKEGSRRKASRSSPLASSPFPSENNKRPS